MIIQKIKLFKIMNKSNKKFYYRFKKNEKY